MVINETNMKKKIGFTASAFDLLHVGHVAMLNECKQNCDFLIVGLHVDPSKERLDKKKPIQSLYERYLLLSGNKYVDKIIPYETEDELLNILLMEPIDIRFIGEDYKDKKIFTGCHLNIPIYYNKRKHKFSSTELRRRIENAQSSIL